MNFTKPSKQVTGGGGDEEVIQIFYICKMFFFFNLKIAAYMKKLILNYIALLISEILDFLNGDLIRKYGNEIA